ncbi:hypothetical protein NDU88_005704 [Pleurodeles waltl]|uniref:Uncharacterized protein n=1 Tax=Pleurodeles waltl TaxID=8319 RepID=A0AAV7LPV2_PLEWA|nr:hypothetical protein NDU88_005704 [Pleurodeles waltl]
MRSPGAQEEPFVRRALPSLRRSNQRQSQHKQGADETFLCAMHVAVSLVKELGPHYNPGGKSRFPPCRRPATYRCGRGIPLQDVQRPGGSGSGHTVQGTEAQDNREAGRTAVRQGEDRPRQPTRHEALSNIMGAYHHSQETMGTVLAKFQETQRLQEEHYLGIREDLKSINTTLVTIAGMLADLLNTRRDTVAHQRANDTSLDDEQPSTSAADASGKEALPQEQQPTSTLPPADGEPP